jgi:hypothetical protein
MSVIHGCSMNDKHRWIGCLIPWNPTNHPDHPFVPKKMWCYPHKNSLRLPFLLQYSEGLGTRRVRKWGGFTVSTKKKWELGVP